MRSTTLLTRVGSVVLVADAGCLDAGTAIDKDADHVRASPRGHIQAALAFVANVSRAFATATDEDAAFVAVEELYEGAPDGCVEELPGADWIKDTCGIDLED